MLDDSELCFLLVGVVAMQERLGTPRPEVLFLYFPLSKFTYGIKLFFQQSTNFEHELQSANIIATSDSSATNFSNLKNLQLVASTHRTYYVAVVCWCYTSLDCFTEMDNNFIYSAIARCYCSK